MPKVSTRPGSVQICDRCGEFMATLLVAAGDGRQVLCEACALELGLREGATTLPMEASDDVPLERAFLLEHMPKLSLQELRLYLWLASLGPLERPPVTRKLAVQACHIDRRSVQRGLEKLIALGLVRECRVGRQDRHYLIVRCVSDAGDRCPAGQLVRPSSSHCPDGRITQEKPIPSDVGGGLYVPPGANPESQGGGLYVPPLGPDDPLGEALGAGGYCFTELGNRRPQSLLLPSSPENQRGGAGCMSPAEVDSGTPPSRAPWRPSGPSTHPPSPREERTSHSSGFPDGNSGPRATWTGYRSRVLADVREQMRRIALDVGEPFTEEQVREYQAAGAEQRWIWDRAQQGAIGSPLHFWCSPDRWLRWLRRRNGSSHANRQDHAANVTDKATRLRICREAAALASGKPLPRTAAKAVRRKGK